MPDEMPSSLSDRETLRCAFRTDGEGGFLFVNNHVRIRDLPAHPRAECTSALRDRSVTFRLDIPSGSAFVMPVNLQLGGLRLKYAAAMPIGADENTLTLREIPGISPVLALQDGRSFLLQEGANCIGDSQVILESVPEYVPTKLTPVQPIEADNVSDPHIMLDFLSKKDLTKEYIVRWSDADKWLVIRATGYNAGFYAEGRLLSDAFLNGDKWVIDLRNVKAREGRIKIQPLTKEDLQKVYFEVPVQTGHCTPEVWTSQEDQLFI